MDSKNQIAAMKLRSRVAAMTPEGEGSEATHFTPQQRTEIAKMRLRVKAARISLPGLLPAMAQMPPYKLMGLAAGAGFVLGFFPRTRGLAKHALPWVRTALSFLQ